MAISAPLNAQESSGAVATSSVVFAGYAVSAGSDRVLVVYTQSENAQTITGVSFGAQSMTQVAHVTEGLNDGSLWLLVAPNVTSADIVLTCTGAINQAIFHACCFTGVDQTTPYEDASTNSDAGATETSIAVDVTTTGAGRVVFAGAGLGDAGAIAAGNGETLINTEAGGSAEGATMYIAVASAATHTMTATFSAARRPNISALALIPAGSGTTYDHATSQGAPSLAFDGAGAATFGAAAASGAPDLALVLLASASFAAGLAGGAPAMVVTANAGAVFAGGLSAGAATLGFALGDDLAGGSGETFDQAGDQGAPSPTFALAATLVPFAWAAAGDPAGSWSDADAPDGVWTDADPETATWTDE